MKKTILVLISGFILLSYSCNNNTTENNDSNILVVNTKDETEELKMIEQQGSSFYHWYFKNEFPNCCDIIKDKNGKSLFDTATYFRKLRELGSISEKFINKEKERTFGCAEFINTIDYSEYEASEAYDFTDYCADIYYMYWIRSQEPPTGGFSIKNLKKPDDDNASLDIYVNYGGADEALSTVILEKEHNQWMITDIKFINRKESPAIKESIYGKWAGGMVLLHIRDTSLLFEYHGQCMYDYPVKKISDNEFEMIWAREMDCKFDNGTNQTFGLKEVPEIGKPFARYKLKNRILYAEYYYKEWVKSYTEKVQADVFIDKYFKRNDN